MASFSFNPFTGNFDIVGTSTTDTSAVDIPTLIDSGLVASPVVDSPSSIVREASSSDDIELLESLPELTYEYDNNGELDIVVEFN